MSEHRSRIVVGVDGSEGSRRALAWAVEEARRRGASVRVTHAWWTVPEIGEHGLVVGPVEQDEVRQKAGEQLVRRMLDEVVPDDVEVETEVVNEHPAIALIDRSGDAECVVVGTRGLGGFEALLLGAVTQQVVQHARCPVVVVPPRH